MLSHERIWSAIDNLAAVNDLTPSGLAKRAGLDSTTFNKSKRFAADGRARWPSTESLSKIMDATGASLSDFFVLVDDHQAVDTLPQGGRAENKSDYGLHEDQADFTHDGPRNTTDFDLEINEELMTFTPQAASLGGIPVVGMAQAGAGGYFDGAGFPAGHGWNEVAFPGADADNNIYALEISGDSMLPLYRDGDIIIVSPTATVRRGDRVVAKTTDGEVMAKILEKMNSITIELSSANPDHENRSFALNDIEWMARILWASQ